MIINIRKKTCVWGVCPTLLLSRKRKKQNKTNKQKTPPNQPNILTVIVSSRSLGRGKYFSYLPLP
jgi:hypothetical protein